MQNKVDVNVRYDLFYGQHKWYRKDDYINESITFKLNDIDFIVCYNRGRANYKGLYIDAVIVNGKWFGKSLNDVLETFDIPNIYKQSELIMTLEVLCKENNESYNICE